MNRLRWTVLKNATANVVRGGAGAAVAFILPPILTRALDRDRFAAWALLLQIAAYANFLDFGIQTAVARFVAQAMERGDNKERDSYISTAFFLLVAAGVLAFGVVCGMAWLVPYMYKQAPLHLLTELREGLILLAAFSALALPTSAFTGVFIGLHKNEYPAFAMGGSRLLGAGLIILAVHRTHSLVAMAGIIGCTNLAGGVVQYALARRMLPTMWVSLKSVTQHSLRSMTKFCAGLSVWSFSMFLVGGLDLTIVGYFRFSGVAYYSVASNPVLIVAGLSSAATSALIAPTAVIHARGEYRKLGAMVVHATRYVTQLLVLSSFPFFLVGTQILTLWVGPVYAHASIHILEVLLLANVVRMIGAPYGAAQVGAGEHVRVVFSPLFEGITNLLASVIAGYYLGPIGVAIGTLVGSFGGLGLQVIYNVPRIPEISIKRRALILDGILEPILELSPALAGISLGVSGLLHGMTVRFLIALCGIAWTGFLFRTAYLREKRFPAMTVANLE